MLSAGSPLGDMHTLRDVRAAIQACSDFTQTGLLERSVELVSFIIAVTVQRVS